MGFGANKRKCQAFLSVQVVGPTPMKLFAMFAKRLFPWGKQPASTNRGRFFTQLLRHLRFGFRSSVLICKNTHSSVKSPQVGYRYTLKTEDSMRFTTASAILSAVVVLGGCGKSGTQANNEVPATTQDTQQQVVEATGPIDTGLEPHANYPVPDWAPDQLVNYINQLVTAEPQGENDDEYIADQVQRARSRLIAADRIILSKGTSAELMEAGVKAKLDALRMLALLDSKGLGVHFAPFVEALADGDSPKFARMGQINNFWFEVDKLVYEQTENSDDLMAELKELLADEEAGEAEFLAAQDASFVMNDRGYAGQATKALKLIGERFQDHEELGKEAKDLLEKTAFREKVIAAMDGGRPEIKDLFVSIAELLKNKEKLNVETLDNTLNAAQVLEFNGHFEEASRVFAAIKKAYKTSDDDRLAKQAKLSVQFAEKRLGMVGEEVDLEGNYIDGTDFSWSKFKGKVVLVDFWASTSTPWVSSLPSLKSAYDRFHSDGFEVLGINVDRDRQRAYEYIRGERLPWPTIVDEVSNGLDGNPNAIRYGIRAVPFVMLVGRDGKVVDIHVRGPELTKRIEELLSEPTSQNARKDRSVRK